MVCPFCQTELSAGDKVCPTCGAPVTEAPAVQPKVEITYDESPVEAVDPGKKSGTVAMVLGIVAAVIAVMGCCCAYISFLPLPIAIVGAIMSLVAMSKSKKAGFKNTNALVGLILSLVSLLLTLAMLIYIIIVIALYGFAGLSSMMSYY